jgi:hypothetical protein
MIDQVGKRQQQRYITFPVTLACTPSDDDSKNIKKKTASAKSKRENKRKVGDKTSKLEASDIVLLDRFPSRRNYTFGRDRTTDAKKEDFPRDYQSCRFLFKHLKRHGLGFLLDLKLDEL